MDAVQLLDRRAEAIWDWKQRSKSGCELPLEIGSNRVWMASTVWDGHSRSDRMTVAISGSGPKGGTHADGNNYGSPPMFLACRTTERQAERRVLKTRSECEHGTEAIRASGPSRAVPKRRGPGCHKETLATAFPSPDLRREASFSTANPCDPPGGAEEAMMKSALPHDMAAPSGVSVA